MSYLDSYLPPNLQRYDDHRYSTKIHVKAPGLSLSSSYRSSSPHPAKKRYAGYSSRDDHYYNYHNDYCHGGAGPSYPAYSSNWEHSRAASPRPYSQRIKIRSDAWLDESPSRRPRRDSNMYRYSGRDQAAARPITTTTTSHRTTHRTTITITTM